MSYVALLYSDEFANFVRPRILIFFSQLLWENLSYTDFLHSMYQENLKWRIFNTEIIGLVSLKLNIKWRENLNREKVTGGPEMTGSSEDNCILEHIKYEEKVQYLLQYTKFTNM
jgi:hypothetical protein